METPPQPFESLAPLAGGSDPTERAKTLGAAIDAVPQLQTWLRQARQEAVAEMHKQGVGSYADIGEILGFSRARAQQIATGYVGGRPRARQVHHLDGDPRNNNVDNLELRDQPDV